jgi:hypothetical protein
MKPKALKKRLELNKKTIASLGETVMNEVYGGHDSSPTCPAFTKYNCLSVYVCYYTECTCISCEYPCPIP